MKATSSCSKLASSWPCKGPHLAGVYAQRFRRTVLRFRDPFDHTAETAMPEFRRALLVRGLVVNNRRNFRTSSCERDRFTLDEVRIPVDFDDIVARRDPDSSTGSADDKLLDDLVALHHSDRDVVQLAFNPERSLVGFQDNQRATNDKQ